MQIDDPAVLAEVTAEFERYEQALVANDVEALVAFFREAPETVRYGIDDIRLLQGGDLRFLQQF